MTCSTTTTYSLHRCTMSGLHIGDIIRRKNGELVHVYNVVNISPAPGYDGYLVCRGADHAMNVHFVTNTTMFNVVHRGKNAVSPGFYPADPNEYRAIDVTVGMSHQCLEVVGKTVNPDGTVTIEWHNHHNGEGRRWKYAPGELCSIFPCWGE